VLVVRSSVADSHHVDADPDPDPAFGLPFDPNPACLFDADLDQIPYIWLVICKLMRIWIHFMTSMRFRIQLITSMWIWNSGSDLLI
jgi:hypothetical protein